MIWRIKYNKDNFYKKYINVATLGTLTKRELDVLSEIALVKELDTSTRKEIRIKLKISEHSLNNFIVKFRKKKYIVDNRINPKLEIPKKDPKITIIFTNEN